MLASIIIRTYNEQIHLSELLTAIQLQDRTLLDIEVVIVDSGSTDDTLAIAQEFGCRITHIQKEDFTFGRSLNIGCDFALGDYLIFVSGHCIPVKTDWVNQLVKPLIEYDIAYSYGKQIGRNTTKFSEHQVFKKFYPNISKVPQKGFFCNNANAALSKSVWSNQPFDEDLTGLEDMMLAKQITEQGKKIAYIAEAPVYHIHDENWHQVRIRYEREAMALQHIMPNIHFTLVNFFHYTFVSIFNDIKLATKEKRPVEIKFEIVLFRLMQYWGTYKGNHMSRQLSAKMKEEYFYPE